MKIYLTSDTHDKPFPDFDESKYDAIFHAGDITNFGFGRPEYELPTYATIHRIHKIKIPFYWIPGNHDIGFQENPPWKNNVHRVVTKVGRKTLVGASMSPCYNLPHLAKVWSHVTANPNVERIYYETLPKADIVLSHCPPTGCDDMDTCSISGTKNLGSSELRKYIERHQPKYCLCGHIHKDDYPYERYIGRTLVINVATLSRDIIL